MVVQLIWYSAQEVVQHVRNYFHHCLTDFFLFDIYLRFHQLVLDAPGKLSKILVGLNKALGEIPLTVKLRTGVKEGRNNAHKLMPRLAAETGIGAMTVCIIILSLLRMIDWADYLLI